tara:strand:- start:26 stop:481 length:456 start_codon:yes stop_codon:yes gene_type:complete
MKTPKRAVCITKRRLKKSAGFSFSSHAKITVNGPIIPVRRTIGELKPSTPSNKEIPKDGAHSYSSTKANPDSLPALKNTTIESRRVKSVVNSAIILGALGLSLKPKVQSEPIIGKTKRYESQGKSPNSIDISGTGTLPVPTIIVPLMSIII